MIEHLNRAYTIDLPAHLKHTLSVLAHHADDVGIVVMTNGELGKCMGVIPRQAQRSKRRLVEMGLLVDLHQQVQVSGRGSVRAYQLNMEAIHD